MGLWKEHFHPTVLLRWGVLAAFVFGLPTVAGVFLVFDQFGWANACFMLTATFIFAKIAQLAITSSDPVWHRLAFTFLLFGVAGIGIVETIRSVNAYALRKREHEFSGVAQPRGSMAIGTRPAETVGTRPVETGSAPPTPTPTPEPPYSVADIKVVCDDSSARIEVTNRGALALFSATLEIKGEVKPTYTGGLHCRWEGSNSEEINIAKGQTRRLIVADRRHYAPTTFPDKGITFVHHGAWWELHALADGVPVLVEGQSGPHASDIILTIEVIANPDFKDGVKRSRITLTPSKAVAWSEIAKPVISPFESSDVGMPRDMAVARPEIIPSLNLSAHALDAFVPLHLENTGSLDAFNVFIAPLSSGDNTIKFAEIDRMRPNDHNDAAPIPSYPAKKRNGLPDLWDFLWRGQLSSGWKEVADDPRVVPPDEIDAIVRKPFILPFTITYNDVNERTWMTRAEFRFGRDRADVPGLAVKVYGVDAGTQTGNVALEALRRYQEEEPARRMEAAALTIARAAQWAASPKRTGPLVAIGLIRLIKDSQSEKLYVKNDGDETACRVTIETLPGRFESLTLYANSEVQCDKQPVALLAVIQSPSKADVTKPISTPWASIFGLKQFPGVKDEAEASTAAGQPCEFRASFILRYDGQISGHHYEQRYDLVHRFEPGRWERLFVERA